MKVENTEIMNYCLMCLVVLETFLIPHRYKAETEKPRQDKFDILLSLYKINPLRQSKIFKAFSNRMLMSNGAEASTVVLNFDSNESVREKQLRNNAYLKHIEEVIHDHVTFSPSVGISDPDYTVDSDVPENFLEDMTRNKIKFKAIKNVHRMNDKDLSSIFDHLTSKEISANSVSEAAKHNGLHEDKNVMLSEEKIFGLQDINSNFIDTEKRNPGKVFSRIMTEREPTHENKAVMKAENIMPTNNWANAEVVVL